MYYYLSLLLQINQEQTKECSLNMYYSIVEKEFSHGGNINRVETQTIDTLDRLVTHKKVENVFEGFFNIK